MLLFALDDAFGRRTRQQQDAALCELQMRARAAGLAGTAAAFWGDASGNTRYLGPRNWEGFLRSVDLDFVLSNVNREIRW